MFSKFFKFSGKHAIGPIWTGCSWYVQKWKFSRKRHWTQDFYVENLEPNRGGKPRPTPCRIFTHVTKRAEKRYNVTLTVTTCNTHSRNLLFEREMNKMSTLLLYFSTQASVRYKMLLLCQLQKLNFTRLARFSFWNKAYNTLLFLFWKPMIKIIVEFCLNKNR